jgi:hypothetical protein
LKIGQHFAGTCNLLYLLVCWFAYRLALKMVACLACYMFHVCFLLVLLFWPEDGGDMFLQKCQLYLMDYMVLYPRRKISWIFGYISCFKRYLKITYRFMHVLINALLDIKYWNKCMYFKRLDALASIWDVRKLN